MTHTIFHKHHLAAGARMVSFAGFEMPIQYTGGIIEEHKRVRNDVGVFDVSHMGEFEVKGADALALIQHVTLNDASKLVPGKAQYSAMCYEDGGIVDDLLVYMLAENNYMLVVNGANIDKDFAWISNHLSSFPNATLNDASNDVHLIAVQGPKVFDALQPLTTEPLTEIAYYSFVHGELAGIPMIISRTGYTGEPGFELYFRGDESVADPLIAEIFRQGASQNIAWIGLGARDTLRLEKGYCLYGNDIDQTTNPLEAGLGWITKLAKGDFIGRAKINEVKAAGTTRKLVGIKMLTEKLIPRAGYEIRVDGKAVGKVTSGNLSPLLNIGIGMGYIEKGLATEGTSIEIFARNTLFPAEVAKVPFL